MPVLIIDSGNTRMKIALYTRHGRRLSMRVAEDHPIECVADVLERCGDVTGAVYGSVGPIDPRFAESLRMMVGGELLIVTGHTPLPIQLEYTTPHTLGVDRMAAAVAIATAHPRARTLIIDAGSAITFDHVTDGKFRGGNISPGLDMRFKALNDHTSRLPRQKLMGDAPLPPATGHDTATAITAGVFGGWVADIAGAVARAIEARYDTVVLTGGDAPLALRAFEDNWGGTTGALMSQIMILHDPDIVTRGLFHIYRYNENHA